MSPYDDWPVATIMKHGVVWAPSAVVLLLLLQINIVRDALDKGGESNSCRSS
jgi:hypothetical protein